MTTEDKNNNEVEIDGKILTNDQIIMETMNEYSVLDISRNTDVSNGSKNGINETKAKCNIDTMPVIRTTTTLMCEN